MKLFAILLLVAATMIYAVGTYIDTVAADVNTRTAIALARVQ